MNTNNQITNLLKKLGLDNREIKIYLTLHIKPWQTVTELAASLDTPRPTLYRVLGEMTKQGIIESQVDYKTTYYAAAPVEAFQNLVITRQQELETMNSALKNLRPLLKLPKAESKETRVSFFRGTRGLQTMEWKIVQEGFASEQLVFGKDVWWKYLGQEFAEEIRRERVKKKITIREILNQKTHSSPAEWTAVTEYSKFYSIRYIDRGILPIENELIITQKGVYLYNLTDTEQVGIKISSQAYASTLKGLFEIVWQMAK